MTQPFAGEDDLLGADSGRANGGTGVVRHYEVGFDSPSSLEIVCGLDEGAP
jgi:hypothetical protein